MLRAMRSEAGKLIGLGLLCITAAIVCGLAQAAEPASMPASSASGAATSQPFVLSDPIVVREVHKKVSEFAQARDMSTPESAYAAINRVAVTGKASGWREASTSRLAKDFAKAKDYTPDTGDAARRWLDAEIIQVLSFRGKYATVVARLADDKPQYDLRSVELENGRWLNTGEGHAQDLKQVREDFAFMCSYDMPKPTYPPVTNPDAARRQMVEFLESHGRDPKTFLLQAIASHPLVVVGETHHRPVYLALLTEVVTAPEFAGGVVYLELPANRQQEVDEFLAKDKLDEQLVIKALRDMMENGWPDQSTLDLFVKVWKANQGRKADQRVRIVLADMPRPYEKVTKPDDFRPWYRIDRNEYMADSVQRDLLGPSKGRKALFIVGFYHAIEGMRLPVGGFPLHSAGWRLRQAFPNMYTVLEHGPVQTNNGQVSGRAALGRFDEAFAALKNRPMAFPLAGSPFGSLWFDRMPEGIHVGSYGQAFDACLFLLPLENESFSKLIDGFYDEAFFKEIKRRAEVSGGRFDMSSEQFTAYMNVSWGRPQKWVNMLGPTDAWVYGSNWQISVTAAKQKEALAKPEIVRAAADKLFESVRNAPKLDDATLWQLNYTTDHWFDAWIVWVKKTFGADPVQKVELGKVFENKEHLPTIDYCLTLKSGRQIRGQLPFRYDALSQSWGGVGGLDWHLNPPATTAAAKDGK